MVNRRWILPAAVAGTIAIGAAVAPSLAATASAPLPERSAADVLASIATSPVTGLSGTVSLSVDLGLPSLPSLGGASTGSPTDLISGTHLLRVWAAQPGSVRVAMDSQLAEYDVVSNGREVWTWDSAKNEVGHVTLPPGRTTPAQPTSPTALTPQALAEQALAAVAPTTAVTSSGTATVAGRAAYELQVVPRQSGSTIGAVLLDVDAATGTPLRVRILPTGSTAPAVDSRFTAVTLTPPAASTFQFTPPAGATVREMTAPTAGARGGRPAGQEPTVLGTGWTSVVVAAVPGGVASTGTGSTDRRLAAVLAQAQRVSGAYGDGRLFSTRLVTVLITDSGVVYAGAVTPQALLAAAASAEGVTAGRAAVTESARAVPTSAS